MLCNFQVLKLLRKANDGINDKSKEVMRNSPECWPIDDLFLVGLLKMPLEFPFLHIPSQMS